MSYQLLPHHFLEVPATYLLEPTCAILSFLEYTTFPSTLLSMPWQCSLFLFGMAFSCFSVKVVPLQRTDFKIQLRHYLFSEAFPEPFKQILGLSTCVFIAPGKTSFTTSFLFILYFMCVFFFLAGRR